MCVNHINCVCACVCVCARMCVCVILTVRSATQTHTLSALLILPTQSVFQFISPGLVLRFGFYCSWTGLICSVSTVPLCCPPVQYTHTRTHTQRHTHAHAHTHTHTLMHTHMRTHTHTHAHTPPLPLSVWCLRSGVWLSEFLLCSPLCELDDVGAIRRLASWLVCFNYMAFIHPHHR